MTDNAHTTPPRRKRWIVPAVLVTFAAVALAFAAVIAVTSVGSAQPLDMRGNPVSYDPDAVPSPAASASADGHGRFTVTSVGLDVPLGSMDAVDGVITPPGFTSAYLVNNVGVQPDRAGLGTVFVTMHSLRGGGVAPGNYLIDVDAERASLERGSLVEADGVSYTVTGSETVTKTDLADRADIWANTPGRLVIITCLQRPDGSPSIDNVIIQATRTDLQAR